jgi:hypothetical protein
MRLSALLDGRGLRRALLVLIVILATAQTSLTAHAQEVDPIKVIQAHFAEWNSVDLSGVLATFSDDVVINANGSMYTGESQVRGWLERFLTPEQNVVPDQFQVDGNHLVWRWIRYGDRSRQVIGVPQTTGEGEATVEQGKITYLRITPNREANAQLEVTFRNTRDSMFATRTAQIDAAATAVAVATHSAERSGGNSVGRAGNQPVMPWVVAFLVSVIGVGVLAASKRPAF